MSKNDVRPMFFSYTRDFLFVHLKERDLRSDNTVAADIVREYLKHLIDKGAALTTRNHRLTSLKQYMLYCSERNVEFAQFYIPVSKIKHVMTRPKKVFWMTRDAVQAVLAQPPKTKLGIRDRFFMIFLYATGARVSEALKVKLKDIETLTNDPFVRLLGKGDKPRCVPLLDIALENLDYYLGLYHPDRIPGDFLFYTVINEHKGKMSIANAERFIKTYGHEARPACSQVPENVHPHLFRHSYGAHLYRMGFSLAVIAKLLDHESLSTTERYAETDTDMVNEAFNTVEVADMALSDAAPIDKKWKAVDEKTLAKLYGLI